MEDPYLYPVFFDCPTLGGEQRKRIEKYFNIRRKSGGGDCGSITNIHDEVYSIAFKERDAQQRVLQRSEHVLEFASGPLVLIVRGSPEPSTCSSVTTSTTSKSITTKLDLTSSQQRQQAILTSGLLTSDEEYELRPDAYLLRYLKECPKAGKALEKELAFVACSAQLYPEEGRVLVRRLAQPDSADDVRNWKAEVDKLFDCYLCHYEVDPHKVKALLQSCSRQTTDEVGVYSEVGMAVVVGERSQVKARLVDVQDRLGLSQKQTSILQLGKAKLSLLWKEIEHSLGRNFPGVKVTQGAAGQLVLEGAVEEILKAGNWISDQGNLVLERTVSDMSPHLLAFLRKAYGGPGVLGDFLGVGDKVEVELRDTELHFFSLSTDNLDETEKALQGEIKEIKIDVPNCSAVPSELQEKLKSKTNEMNQEQYRAQFVLCSDNTVCLLGHTKEVEELSEAVVQFILDQSSVQSIVHLPFIELAQELPQLLQQHMLDYSGITFHPLTSSSGTVVVLGGPSSKVTEFRSRLDSFLDIFLQSRITIDPIGTVRNVPLGKKNSKKCWNSKKCSTGKDELQNFGHNLASVRLSEVNTTVASYSLFDGLKVLVCQGDITKQDADALVNAANEDLDHSGGVAAALSKAGGPEVQSESNALVKYIGKIPTGDVVVTTGGNLNCKKLLHAVGPVGGKWGDKERALLEKTVQSVLNLSEMMTFHSIAIPCISSGTFGFPVTVCSEAIVTAVKKFSSQGDRSLRRIILIDNREEVVKAMHEACDRLLQGISTGNSAPRDLGFLMDAAAQDTSRGATAGAPGNGVHIEIIQGTIETQQVDALVSPMVGHHLFSTCVGSTLLKMVGSQLTAKFRKEAGEDTMPGDTVLVEGLPGLPSNAVFFLNLISWDDDQDGVAVQVLRLAINNILTTCEKRGFESVALPVIGAGIALRFPDSVVARVLVEEVLAFEQKRASRTPFLVRIVIHPNDDESIEAFRSVQLKGFTKDIHQPHQASATRRIILLGKTGSGKSNLANTIFGETLFTTNHSPNSGTSECQAETKSVNGRSITLIDTPGFFDAGRSEEDLKPEIMRCITECAPGPHAFFIVLKVEKFTEHEEAVITKICQYFSEDALKYAVIVFTHGDQLPKGMKIEEFVSQNENLSDLVKKCSGRCHVVDNKYWKNKLQNNYRSNHVQVEELLNTTEKMVMENNEGYYTNAVFQEVEKEIQTEEKRIQQSSGNMQQEEIRKKAKSRVSEKFLIQLAGTATGALLGAFFGVAAMVGLVITALHNCGALKKVVNKVPVLKGAAAAAAAGGEVAGLAVAGVVLGVSTAGFAATGGVIGGIIGNDAAEGAETVQEAAERAANAVINKGRATFKLS